MEERKIKRRAETHISVGKKEWKSRIERKNSKKKNNGRTMPIVTGSEECGRD